MIGRIFMSKIPALLFLFYTPGFTLAYLSSDLPVKIEDIELVSHSIDMETPLNSESKLPFVVSTLPDGMTVVHTIPNSETTSTGVLPEYDAFDYIASKVPTSYMDYEYNTLTTPELSEYEDMDSIIYALDYTVSETPPLEMSSIITPSTTIQEDASPSLYDTAKMSESVQSKTATTVYETPKISSSFYENSHNELLSSMTSLLDRTPYFTTSTMSKVMEDLKVTSTYHTTPEVTEYPLMTSQSSSDPWSHLPTFHPSALTTFYKEASTVTPELFSSSLTGKLMSSYNKSTLAYSQSTTLPSLSFNPTESIIRPTFPSSTKGNNFYHIFLHYVGPNAKYKSNKSRYNINYHINKGNHINDNKGFHSSNGMYSSKIMDSMLSNSSSPLINIVNNSSLRNHDTLDITSKVPLYSYKGNSSGEYDFHHYLYTIHNVSSDAEFTDNNHEIILNYHINDSNNINHNNSEENDNSKLTSAEREIPKNIFNMTSQDSSTSVSSEPETTSWKPTTPTPRIISTTYKKSTTLDISSQPTTTSDIFTTTELSEPVRHCPQSFIELSSLEKCLYPNKRFRMNYKNSVSWCRLFGMDLLTFQDWMLGDIRKKLEDVTDIWLFYPLKEKCFHLKGGDDVVLTPCEERNYFFCIFNFEDRNKLQDFLSYKT